MAPFELRVIVPEALDSDGRRHAVGEIVLGAFRERFEMSLEFWSAEDYEAQWRAAVARLEAGQGPSAFLTSYRGQTGAYHFIRAVWLDQAGTLSVQEQLWLQELHNDPFDPEYAWRDVGALRTIDEDGAEISTWTVVEPAFQVGR